MKKISVVVYTVAVVWGIGVRAIAQQPCRYMLTGTITDAMHHAIPGAHIKIPSDSTLQAITDSLGNFTFTSLCEGTLQIQCTAAGYAGVAQYVPIEGDKQHIAIVMKESNSLYEVVVNAVKTPDIKALSITTLNSTALFQARGASLGQALEKLPGLSVLQSGANTAKPVLHGMHSNRLLIINNGIRQEGQQWGTDHAPEIDPFIANNISVLKGAASARYGSDAIAGVIVVDADPLPANNKLGGLFYALGNTNGRAGGISGQMEGAINRKQINYAWRIQGTLKKGGNYAAPAYYLKNTGYEEADYSITWGIKHHIADLKAYYSQYAAKNGIFEGAHAGNLTDLYAAFNRPVPTAPSYFSYAIDRSYQQLNHQIAKLSITKHLPDNASLEATYSFQTDKRYEYDLSLPYTSDPNLLAQPQVAFQLNTQSVSLHCTQPTQNGLTGNFGIDASTQSNVFKGIRYLIPNFRNYTIGIYAIERYKYKKFSFEIGGRYDYRWLRVYLLNPSTLIPYHSTYEYKKPSISVGFTYLPQANWQITLHTGTAWRAPSVNEMYIHGIHFGDAKYQNGDSTLLSERTINTGIFTKYTAKKWNIYGEAYCNNIQNYIYEMPTLQPVVLVSGTYPAFRFTQHHAIIAGGEVAMELKPVKNVVLSAKASTVYGYNKTLSRYLIYMPADRAIATLQWNIHSLKALKDPYIELQGIAVAKQNRVPDSSDFVPPPPAYQLINLNIGGTIPLKNHYLQFDFGINNLLNTTFRDYLNRYRYYANDMGRNLSLKAKISF